MNHLVLHFCKFGVILLSLTTLSACAAQPQHKDIYAPAMASMHQDMMIAPTGDADVDFVRGMIPHHQGAVDMAKIELAHGDDPKIRKLAKNIIRSQEQEIAMMRAWLKRHDRGAQKPPAKHAHH
jgi:uncharacterized protein (DUF305 family)